MFKILLFLILFLPQLAFATTYYVDENGTAANKGEAIGGCGEVDASTQMSVATYSAETFSPGDVIYICGVVTVDQGGEQASAFLIPSSGTEVGGDIIYRGDHAAESGTIKMADGANENYMFNVSNDDYISFIGLTFDANGAGQGGGQNQGVIVTNTSSYITFDTCTFQNANYANVATGYGLSCATVSYITVQNCTFQNCTGHCALFSTASNVTIDDNTCTAYRGGFHFSTGACPNATVTDNVVSGWASGADAGFCIQYGSGCTGDTIVVSGNTCSDPGGNNRDAFELSFMDDQTDVTVSNNIFTNSGSDGDFGIVVNGSTNTQVDITDNSLSDVKETGIYTFGGNGHIITRNIVLRAGVNGVGASRTGIYIAGGDVDATYHAAAQNHTVAHNIVSDSYRGLKLYGDATYPASSNKFYSNTVYNCTDTSTGYGFYAQGTGSGTKFKNNAIHTPGYYFVNIEANQQTTFDASNNGYYTAGTALWKWGGDTADTSLSDWQSACSSDANSITVQPFFYDASNDDFRLVIGSSYVGAGVDVGLTTDYLNNTVPLYYLRPSIGAYEVPVAKSSTMGDFFP